MNAGAFTLPSAAPSSRKLNVASWAVLLATFPLIFMGGLVTTKGAGMSVPDWPNSYGYNMFLFPPSQWQGGIFFEHTHRLLGTLVGFLAIIQTAVAWGPARKLWARRAFGLGTILFAVLTLASAAYWEFGTLSPKMAEKLPHLVVSLAGTALTLGVCWACRSFEPRRWVRWLCVALLGSIIVQGIMGGLRVDLVNIELAIIHGVFAQVVLCGLAFACVATSRWWAEAKPSPTKGNLAAVGFVMFGVISLQLVIGAMMRHYGAGLAVPDVPLIYGKVIPPTSDAGLAAANTYRISLHDTTLPPVTLGKIWLHAAHRYGALLVAIGTLGLVWHVFRGTREGKLRMPASWLGGLIGVQITLGLLTVYFRKDAIVTTGHHMVGALMLVITFVLAVRAARLREQKGSIADAGVGNMPRSEPANA